ncbi:MAG: phosphatidate cytidylyltransferase [Alphaproteobacteria bacterium]|nr:MAG: phosphatidate cytidylyltransferase [Alphaproteobacteria bacterium]
MSDRRRWADLPRRLISAAVLAVTMLGALWAGTRVLSLVVYGITLVTIWEWLLLVTRAVPTARQKKNSRSLALAFLAVMAVALGVYWVYLPQMDAHRYFLTWLVSLLGLSALPGVLSLCRRDSTWAAPWLGAGLPYIVGAGLGMMALIVHATSWATYLILVSIAADSGGYFAGRWIGGPKLCPQFSPKKTWSGMVGALILSAVTGGVLVAAGLVEFGMGWPLSTLLGLGLALVAQTGDMLESLAKRRFGAKDAGTALPGHGGFLDRVDSHLLVAWIGFVSWAV